MLVNLVQFSFSVKADVYYYVCTDPHNVVRGVYFTVDHSAVAVSSYALAYSLTRTLSVAFEYNHVNVDIILRLLRISETVIC